MSQSTLQLLLLVIAALLFLGEALRGRLYSVQLTPGAQPGYGGALFGWLGLCLVAIALLVPLVGK